MMKKLCIMIVLFFISESYSQKCSTINEIIESLNNEIFSFKIDKNAKYFKNDMYDLIDENIFQNDDFYFTKLLSSEDVYVYYIIKKVDLDSYSFNLVKSSPFKLIIYSKSINHCIVLSFMTTNFINKISENEFKISFSTSYDLIFSNKLILNSSFEVTHLAKINWIERDLPIDLKPMTSFKIQNYRYRKNINNADLGLNYLNLNISSLFAEIFKIDEVDSNLIFKMEESNFDYQSY